MRIGRVLPPAASPLGWRDVCLAATRRDTSGSCLRRLEEDFSRALGARRVFLVSSGTAALMLALLALKAGSARRKVVIPAYSCFSVPAAVIGAGLEPVLCDIEPSTYGLDAGQLSHVIDQSTLAVVAQHLFGIPSAIESIVESCRANGTSLVEDAAQAMGVTSNGRWLGTFGDAGMFSFGRGKHLTAGNGGMIATSSGVAAAAIERQIERLGGRLRVTALGQLARAGALVALIHPWLYWIPSAMPWLRLGETIYPARIPAERMGAVPAALLRSWRERLAVSHEVRIANAADFAARLEPRAAVTEGVPYLRFPVMTHDVAERERVLAVSRDRGLGISRGYPSAVDRLPQMRPFLDDRRFPVARDVAERLVTLPTHHLVTARDRAAIQSCFAAAPRPRRSPQAA